MQVTKKTIKAAKEAGLSRSFQGKLLQSFAKYQPLLTARLITRYQRVPFAALATFTLLDNEAEGQLPPATEAMIDAAFEKHSKADFKNEQPVLTRWLKKHWGEIPGPAWIVYDIFQSYFQDEKETVSGYVYEPIQLETVLMEIQNAK